MCNMFHAVRYWLSPRTTDLSTSIRGFWLSGMWLCFRNMLLLWPLITDISPLLRHHTDRSQRQYVHKYTEFNPTYATPKRLFAFGIPMQFHLWSAKRIPPPNSPRLMLSVCSLCDAKQILPNILLFNGNHTAKVSHKLKPIWHNSIDSSNQWMG